MAVDPKVPMSFTEFPEDIQVNILSFLSLAEISAFACTCRRFAALCSRSSPSTDLWFALCHRRWGSKTCLNRWSAVPSPRLYRTFDRWEHLIGFWRRIGSGAPDTPPLLFFEWDPSSITGSRVSPSPSSYAVQKIPFLLLGLSSTGDSLHLNYPPSDNDVLPATISFMGCNHLVVEESSSFCLDAHLDDSEEVLGLELETGSPPDLVMSEIYQYFANRTTPRGEKSSRRQRKKKERLGRRRETEHFVKIANFCPTPVRPLQGLWKGISEDMSLDFYLVMYDDVGGITCRRVGDVGEPLSGYYSMVFWTSNATFFEPPFSIEEQVTYSMREHVRPVGSDKCNMEREVVSRIFCINSSYDLVLPNLADSSGDPRNVEGRIWEYEDGTFGFGFLGSNFIVDLKHIALDGYLLDTVEYSDQTSF